MTGRAHIRRHPERAANDEVSSILADGLVAHVGFSQDGQPYVIPFSYYYDPARAGRLYLHGAPASRALQHLASGAPMCISITLLDGLVYSRTAMFHSMNYRSVVLFGRGRRVTDEAEKRRLFERMIERYFKGRTAGRDYETPPPAHLAATELIEVEIEEASAKARRGGPRGPHDKDPDARGTSGVIKLHGAA
jgi:nitroimidazol reductase NimA-like FMN-containing flavoprotein (pyridoxamine 5'-phosphate oxidase superfamily)